MATKPLNCGRYCPAGPCADTCLRMDDPNPIEMPDDRRQRVAARIRTAREGLTDDECLAIPLRRAVEIYYGRTAPSARELALYAEACGVTVDWLLTGMKDAREATGAPVSAPECENGPMGVQASADPPDGRTADPDTVPVPTAVLADLVKVAAHVSVGKSFAFVGQDRPYPDATARRALGALDDAGLLDQFRTP